MISRDAGLRLSLGLWICVAGVLLLVAPPPPPPPITASEDEAIFQRTVDHTVDKARRWQAERGDQTIAWDQASGHLAIVIDDVGRELHLFEQLLALRSPLSFSVVPDTVYAPGAQLRLRGDRRRPREILLQMPADGALPAALERVPGAVGVSDPAGVATAATLQVLRERGLFLLATRPTSADPAEHAAVPVLAGDVLLDADPAPAAVLAALERAAQRARDRPTVIVAHPSQVVVETLREGLPRLHREGIGVYPLREILTRSASPSAQ